MKLFPLMMVAGIAVGATTAASAAPVITFIWSPGGASTPLSGGDVTADNITTADFASATINPITGAFTETGALKIVAFGLGGSGVLAPGLNSTYGLYLTFNATGNQGGPLPLPGHSTSGPITSISYTLWGNPSGSPTFTVGNGSVTIGNNVGAFALATGTGGGTLKDFVSLQNVGGGVFIPSANALLNFTPAAGESGFFVSPPASIMLNLEAAFTNTPGTAKVVVSGGSTFLNITGGGGDLDFVGAPVPEPTTLAVLGVGLLGLGMLRRKQK